MLPLVSSSFLSSISSSSSSSSSSSHLSPLLFNSTPNLFPGSSRRRRRLPPPCDGGAGVGKEESQLEFDRERAREALQKLDQQLDSLAQQQQTQLPKPKKPSTSSYSYSDPSFEREMITGMRSMEELPELSRSYLSYSAVALLILTLFNNIVFNVFIKPSVDGPTERASLVERVPLSEP